jgi:hypothetical protein
VIFRDLQCRVIIDDVFRVIFYDTVSLLVLYNTVGPYHFPVLPECHILENIDSQSEHGECNCQKTRYPYLSQPNGNFIKNIKKVTNGNQISSVKILFSSSVGSTGNVVFTGYIECRFRCVRVGLR